MLLFFTVLMLSACTNTQPKDSANKTNVWGDFNTHGSNESLVKPNLTGTWVLNADLSENPQEELKESMRQSGNSRGGKGMGDVVEVAVLNTVAKEMVGSVVMAIPGIKRNVDRVLYLRVCMHY